MPNEIININSGTSKVADKTVTQAMPTLNFTPLDSINCLTKMELGLIVRDRDGDVNRFCVDCGERLVSQRAA